MENLKLPLKIPSMEEVTSACNEVSGINALYIKRQTYYRLFVSALFEEKLGLSRLDRRLEERSIPAVQETEKNFYQKYEVSGMKYLYLRSYIHIERLTQEEAAILVRMDDHCKEAEAMDMKNLVENTWRKVLELDHEFPERIIEVYPSIDGSGRCKGNSILLGLSSKAEYDKNGNFADEGKEDERIKMMLSVAQQLEDIASRVLETNVKVVVEV